METWQAVNSIRVVVQFADRPLEPQHLERILNAARRTGSSKNTQDMGIHRRPRPQPALKS